MFSFLFHICWFIFSICFIVYLMWEFIFYYFHFYSETFFTNRRNSAVCTRTRCCKCEARESSITIAVDCIAFVKRILCLYLCFYVYSLFTSFLVYFLFYILYRRNLFIKIIMFLPFFCYENYFSHGISN